MPDSVAITFAICTYNRADYLDDTLLSLRNSEAPARPVELLVINNNSTDHTKSVVKAHKKKETDRLSIRLALEENQGLSHARNRGIKEADAPIIIFVDDDIRADEHYINAWLTFFDSHPNTKAAGGKIHVQFDDPRPKWMSSYLLPLLGHHDHGDSIKPYKTNDYPFGGNMAFKKEVFDEIGQFNTELGRIGSDLKASEEKELFQRYRSRYENIFYVPDAKLHHRVNSARLTKEYIRRQAVGLGQSLALQLQNKSVINYIRFFIVEAGKWLATLALFLGYLATFKLPKGIMLIKFRKWIASGFLEARKTISSAND
jgi:glycosyltransferase involved in cell wall biosynthesis